MNQQIEATLTGTDTPVYGVANKINFRGAEAWEFNSLDSSLHLIIAKDNHGHWERLGGTEPYLSGWIGELAQQVV